MGTSLVVMVCSRGSSETVPDKGERTVRVCARSREQGGFGRCLQRRLASCAMVGMWHNPAWQHTLRIDSWEEVQAVVVAHNQARSLGLRLRNLQTLQVWDGSV